MEILGTKILPDRMGGLQILKGSETIPPPVLRYPRS